MDSSLNMDLWQKTWEGKLAAHEALEDDTYNGMPACSPRLKPFILENFSYVRAIPDKNNSVVNI